MATAAERVGLPRSASPSNPTLALPLLLRLPLPLPLPLPLLLSPARPPRTLVLTRANRGPCLKAADEEGAVGRLPDRVRRDDPGIDGEAPPGMALSVICLKFLMIVTAGPGALLPKIRCVSKTPSNLSHVPS